MSARPTAPVILQALSTSLPLLLPLPKKAPRAATWRDDAKQHERDAVKAAEEAAAPPKKVVRRGFDALDVEADNV